MSYSDWLALISLAGGFACGCFLWATWAAWWLGKQFSILRELVRLSSDTVQRNIESKLEYHERHDDARFSDLKNDLWLLRVRAAAKDGLVNGKTVAESE